MHIRYAAYEDIHIKYLNCFAKSNKHGVAINSAIVFTYVICSFKFKFFHLLL